MPAKDLGTKYVCFKCGTRFYDLKKPEPLCPKCGADQRQSPAQKSPLPEKRSRAPKPAAAVVVEEVEVEEADLDEELESDELEADETDDE